MRSDRLTPTVTPVLLLIATIAALALVASPSEARSFFGVASNASRSDLYSIDPVTGMPSLIGSIAGFDSISGIAFHPTTGVLYAVGFGRVPVGGRDLLLHVLLSVDPATGTGTLIGPTHVDSVPGVSRISDISFRSDGTLYGYAEPGDKVGTLDTSTGEFSLLGPSDASCCGNGIAFSLDDANLYHANDNHLNFLDQASGQATPGPSLIFPPDETCPAPARVNALSVEPRTGTLFGTVNCGNSVRLLVTIDATTGGMAVRGTTVGRIDAIAFRLPNCEIEGTVQKIVSVTKNGQISINLRCEARRIPLGPLGGENPRPTYARITSLLQDDSGIEYVNQTGGAAPMPVNRLCLKARSGASERSVKYEASVRETDRRLRDTTFSITVSRKEFEAEDCASGRPCSRYDSQVRVDRAWIENTSSAPSCVFTTELQIFEGNLASTDGTCPDDEGIPALAFWAEVQWLNFDTPPPGDCSPPKLRTPTRP